MDSEMIMAMVVSTVVSRLTDDELATVNLVMQLDQDPRNIECYGKAACLFTQDTGKGYNLAHALTKQAVLRETTRRLSKEAE